MLKVGTQKSASALIAIASIVGCGESGAQSTDLSVGEAAAGFLMGRSTEGVWTAQVPGSAAEVVFDESSKTYRLDLDGQGLSRDFPKKPLLRMRLGTFDPVQQDPITLISPALRTSFLESDDGSESQAYLVQFMTQPIEAMQEHLSSIGVRLLAPFPDHAYIVHMDGPTASETKALPFVRWVGRYHPALKLDAAVADRMVRGDSGPERYSVMLMQSGSTMQDLVAERVRMTGGEVELTTQGRRMVVRLNRMGLMRVAAMKEVLFIDEPGEKEDDLDIARQISGADAVEAVRGYSGEGVRAEVMDSGLRTTHTDFVANPPLIHVGNGSSTFHGTAVYGIVFGDGTSDSRGRGLIPDAEQPIFSSYITLGDRFAHTARLVDPSGPYRAVFQTNSWGNARTFNYTTISADMDEILFENDILILQSQSNAGDQDSRPQAWAKNILSVGGVRHFNTLDRSDDQWNFGASIGPASDGRIKPDLWHFYDLTFAPSSSSNTSYTEFGGTSGATPVTAGYMGLIYQMWADGVFNGAGPGQNRDVFDARPHMTTAKALAINTAHQYPFSGTSDDKNRVHQGWGMVDVENLYDIAESNNFLLPVVVDESLVIGPTEIQTIPVATDGSAPLKITLVYADPPGTPGAARHRVNDLTLRVIGPTGTVYWGNHGLLTGVWSTPGGSANEVDTVENVFIQNPQAGTWNIEVRADEIVQDGHTETPALDADYALVVTTRYASN